MLRQIAIAALWMAATSCSNPEDVPFANHAPNSSSPNVGTSVQREAGGTASIDAGQAPTSSMGTFDPEKMYVIANLEQGSCPALAITEVGSRSGGLIGFPCTMHEIVIHTSTGRIVYVQFAPPATTNEFSCDAGCRYFSKGELSDYPYDVTTNDSVIPTTVCGGIPISLLAGPDGTLVYRCHKASKWYDTMGAEVGPSMAVLALGSELRGLGASEEGGLSIVDFKSGALTPIVGLPDGLFDIGAIRSSTDGFVMTVPDRTKLHDEPALWEIGFDGQASRVGVYPPPPEGVATPTDSRLGSKRTLYSISQAGDDHLIVRRTLDGQSDIVYSEADDPPVLLSWSRLVTGP